MTRTTCSTCAQCGTCGVAGVDLRACAGCHGSFYCNPACQAQHHAQHKGSCREYARSSLHCAVCDRTVDAKVCTTCYKVAVCDRDDCGERHRAGQACAAPPDTTELAVLADVARGEDGTLVIPCQDGVTHAATMAGLLTMLMLMEKIPMLLDRVYLVYVTFGGTGIAIPDSATPETFPENFYCEGPLLGVTFSNRADYKCCADGMWRTPAVTVHIVPGAGGPAFDLEDTAPVSVGRNLLKVQLAVIPLGSTAPSRNHAGHSG